MQEADLSPVAGECWEGAEGTSGVLLPVAPWPGERCPKQLLLDNRRRQEMMKAKGTHLYALVEREGALETRLLHSLSLLISCRDPPRISIPVPASLLWKTLSLPPPAHRSI